MSEIAYVHSAKQPVGYRYDRATTGYVPYLLMPVGVIGLANLLIESGYSFRGVNYAIEAFLNPAFDLRAWLRDLGEVKMVLIDLHWYEHAYAALDVARVSKEVLPKAKVVLGGITASLFANEILQLHPQVDFVICGDAEEPLLQLAAVICRGSSAIGLSGVPNLARRVGNGVAISERMYCASADDLDRLDFVSLGFLDHPRRYMEMEYTGAGIGVEPENLNEILATTGHWLSVGRGCQFDCSYCGGGKEAHRRFAGRGSLVLRSVDTVIDDIARLAAMGVDQVSLALDPAMLGRPYWSALFAGLRSKGIRIGIYNEHFQLPTAEFIREFVATADLSHSVLAFTPLSGSERVRKLNGKFFTNDKLYRTLYDLKAYDIPVFVYFSLNLPGEDEKAFKRTLGLAERIYRIYPTNRLRLYNMRHVVDPFSPMYNAPQNFGIELGMHTFQDYLEYSRRTYMSQPGSTARAGSGFTQNLRDEAVLVKMAQAWNEAARGREHTWMPLLSV